MYPLQSIVIVIGAATGCRSVAAGTESMFDVKVTSIMKTLKFTT